MALDAVVYPQDYSFSSYGFKDCYSGAGEAFGYDFDFQEDDKSFLGILETNNIEQQSDHKWENPDSSPENPVLEPPPQPLPTAATTGRKKRRRTRSTKNKEEIENQRMTHIAVERNRRKQMNEYLAVLRSLMPSSYVQRGDQASIIGGAINFVKELEQLLQTMEVHKNTKLQKPNGHLNGGFSSPFSDFFTFPQYSTRTPATGEESLASVGDQNQWAVADIEVTMMESHANLKILSKKRARQLLKIVAGLQGLRLSVLHLNVTTVDSMVLYSVSVKIEEGCHLNTVDDIAAAVNQMLHRVYEEEAGFS
ncbi:transcription factor bHLH96-like [Mercurialis annua]|uniref:transcription factor bHLH96-like n=1 Tax=Mercurialis annua TaxID=3986 RepID=UPI002160F0BB|nr:transcription factor bHLH96-like [Mercurialis annua]